MELSTSRKQLWREDEASIDVGAVRNDRIDLGGGLSPYAHPLDRSPTRVAPDDHDVVDAQRPLALDTQQPAAEVKDEVVSATLLERSIDIDTKLDGRSCNLGLRNRALTIGR
jgi:hypothetical protein